MGKLALEKGLDQGSRVSQKLGRQSRYLKHFKSDAHNAKREAGRIVIFLSGGRTATDLGFGFGDKLLAPAFNFGVVEDLADHAA